MKDREYYFDESSIRKIVKSIRRADRLPHTDPNLPRYQTRRGVDKFRLIRGQCIANYTTANTTIVLNRVVVLSGGFDPSYGDPTAEILVANTIWPRDFSINQYVDAIYSPAILPGPPEVDWETLETGSGGQEKFRLARGFTKGIVPATPGIIFEADNLISLAGGLDPSGGSPLNTVKIEKRQTEELDNGSPITLIYEPIGTAGTGAQWELLLTERYRLIRGLYLGMSGTHSDIFRINAVDVLASGLDPRTQTGSATEEVLIRAIDSTQIPSQVGKVVHAAYNRAVATTLAGQPVNWEMLSGAAGTGGSDSLQTVVILRTAAPALFDPTTRMLFAGTGTAPLWTVSGTGLTFSRLNFVTYEHRFVTPVKISADGYARIAHLVGGVIVNVDCHEIFVGTGTA